MVNIYGGGVLVNAARPYIPRGSSRISKRLWGKNQGVGLCQVPNRELSWEYFLSIIGLGLVSTMADLRYMCLFMEGDSYCIRVIMDLKRSNLQGQRWVNERG